MLSHIDKRMAKQLDKPVPGLSKKESSEHEKAQIKVEGSKMKPRPLGIYAKVPKGSLATPPKKEGGLAMGNPEKPMKKAKEGFGKRKIFGGFTGEVKIEDMEKRRPLYSDLPVEHEVLVPFVPKEPLYTSDHDFFDKAREQLMDNKLGIEKVHHFVDGLRIKRVEKILNSIGKTDKFIDEVL